MPQAQPELKRYVDKRVVIQLNGNRRVQGLVRGFDIFLNIVLDEAVEEQQHERIKLGMVIVRGQSVVMIEPIDRIEAETRQGGR